MKKQKILPLSEVELINVALNRLHSQAKVNTVVAYKGLNYQRRILPLKLSKSGKIVQRWAKFWLLQPPDGNVDQQWEKQVREIWPKYFLIRTIEI